MNLQFDFLYNRIMYKSFIVLIVGVFNIACLYAQKTVLATYTGNKNIKSLQIFPPNSSHLLPVIRLNSDDKVIIKFDNLDINQSRLRYKLIHCNYDWTASDLNEIDYIKGFNDNHIDTYKYSVNTNVDYIHYNLELPNRNVGFNVSGNYVLMVYDEYSPKDTLLTARFYVVDQIVGIDGSITSNTDIGLNLAHQQLSLEINHKGITIQNPERDINLVVFQNMSTHNMAKGIKPSYIYSDRLVYNHNKALIFEGGNEYRRFETVNKRTGGLNVDKVEYKRPYINVRLATDEVRSGNVRYYDEDQNGRYFVRSESANDNDIESDYFLVHFSLANNNIKMNRGVDRILLDGEFITNNAFLEYDPSNNIYHTSLLLKQGSYNYQYLIEKSNGIKTPSFIEGSYFDTENSYSIFVYYRFPGSRYDQLIGFLEISLN